MACAQEDVVAPTRGCTPAHVVDRLGELFNQGTDLIGNCCHRQYLHQSGYQYAEDPNSNELRLLFIGDCNLFFRNCPTVPHLPRFFGGTRWSTRLFPTPTGYHLCWLAVRRV